MTGTDLVATPNGAELEADPVQYMAVVLNRAKGWLAEAQNLESVRETKAIAVGYESVIREKELAFDAQLSATEIVRRCEKRIGELIREGQRDGSITKRSDNRYSLRGQRDDLVAPYEAAGLTESNRSVLAQQVYPMAEASQEQFEDAITAAREEGNLSRANVVRKIKGEPAKPKESPVAGAVRPAVVVRIAEQAEAMAMAIGALNLPKSCERMTEDERQSALDSCKAGLRALNTMARALGR